MHSLPDLLQPVPTLAAFDFAGWLAEIVYSAMVATFAAVVAFMTTVTNPDLGGDAFQSQFAIMRSIAMYMVVPMMLVATMLAIIKGSLAKLLNMYLIAVPAAIIGAPISVLFIRMLEAIDWNFTQVVVNSTLEPAVNYTSSIKNSSELLGGVNNISNVVLMILGSIVMLIALIFLGLELAFRSVMISVGALFLPFAMAMAVWEPARRFLVVLIETIVVLVFSHFICIAIFFFGLALSINGFNDGDIPAGVEHIVVGGIVAIMACTSLPALLIFVLGSNPATRHGHQEIVSQSSLSMATGAADVRKMAVKGFMDQGKKVGKAAKAAKAAL